MRIEQSVGSYPTLRCTVTADILTRSEDFSGSVIVSRHCSWHWSFPFSSEFPNFRTYFCKVSLQCC